MGQFKTFAVMHPKHIEYLNELPGPITLDLFFNLLDPLNSDKREDFFSTAYLFVINPQDYLAKTVTYETFKSRCYEAAKVIGEYFLVYGIVSLSLQSLFGISNIAEIDEKLDSTEEFLKRIQLVLDKRHGRPIPADQENIINHIEHIFEDKSDEMLEEMLHLTDEKMIQELPDRTKANYVLYEEFCNTIVATLLEIKPQYKDK